jgi:hypothetical protein
MVRVKATGAVVTRTVVLCRCRPNKRPIASGDGPHTRAIGFWTLHVETRLAHEGSGL